MNTDTAQVCFYNTDLRVDALIVEQNLISNQRHFRVNICKWWGKLNWKPKYMPSKNDLLIPFVHISLKGLAIDVCSWKYPGSHTHTHTHARTHTHTFTLQNANNILYMKNSVTVFPKNKML